MNDQKITDPFFYDQPPLSFIEELKSPLHEAADTPFEIREKKDGEISVTGLFIRNYFEEYEGVLKTAYDDFEAFLRAYKIGGECFPLHIIKVEGYSAEEHKIKLSEDGFFIYASDTEGVRRALVYIEDEIKAAECCCLPPFEITRKPFIKTRITRCFFGPINRPPKNIDELYDDVDYYPENYLQRLVHDGSNAIWIYVNFSDLLKSPVVKEFGRESERRLLKLSRVVEKCKNYGIKIYVLGCEPMGLSGELAEKYSDMLGAEGWGGWTICPRTERGKEHIVGTVKELFSRVPDLGGFISITAGELATSCASMDSWSDCPRCSQYPRGESVAYTAELIKGAMREVGSKGDFISFSYGQRYWNFNDITDYVATAPTDVMLMQNFDDFGFVEQLGKTRLSIDYWLSYAGPSYLFEHTARAAKKHGKHLFAKMQVCSSHEIATVPCIPTPGILYDKYKAAYELGVEGIMQCWYFGNYPSLMSRAAGELSFLEKFPSKKEFLIWFAARLYGKSRAEAVGGAFECFEKSYVSYPVNTMFSYYGPMHDGVCWELSLLPKDKPLPESWMSTDKPDGDRIYEATNAAHSLGEVLTLADTMCREWEMGVRRLEGISGIDELSTLAGALMTMLSSGRNILEFYKLRQRLGFIAYGQKENADGLLSRMREIVLEEIKNSEKISALCEKNSKLGYHSEAEAFKFFPKKCAYRIDTLKALLDTEFPIVKKRISEGKVPLGFYLGEGITDVYPLTESLDAARADAIGKSTLRLTRDSENLNLYVDTDKREPIVICFEFMLCAPSAVMKIEGGKLSMNDKQDAYLCGYYGENYDREMKRYRIKSTERGYEISISRSSYEISPDAPIRLKIKVGNDYWKCEEEPVRNLGKTECSPGEFGWIIPEK